MVEAWMRALLCQLGPYLLIIVGFIMIAMTGWAVVKEGSDGTIRSCIKKMTAMEVVKQKPLLWT